jgi:large subunit ribosomal protein L6
MSRIGKQPIAIPNGVNVSVDNGVVKVSGPKGNLEYKTAPTVKVEVVDGQVVCSVGEKTDDKSKFGLCRSIIANMVEGCNTGFKKVLDVNGVGYRAQVQGQTLELTLGFSHNISHPIPEGIFINVEGKTNQITIEGADKQLVGQVAAEVRGYRSPEPYNGKGVKYETEVIRRKAGKSAGA